MAAGGLSGNGNTNCQHGYKCIIKEGTTPDDFQCTSCGNILKEPSLTACCSQSFCSDFLKGKKRCPCCDKELHCGFNVFLHKEVQKLPVMCIQQTHGCEWEGKIMDLDEHMLLCEHVQVTCNKCDQTVGVGQQEAHLAEECPEREYSCPHCGFKDTHSFVTKAHFPLCSNAPVTCPNKCGAALERDNIDKHLEDDCPLHYLACLFREAGCSKKFRREDRGEHMQESIGTHLASLANFTFKASTKVEELISKKVEREGNEDSGQEQEEDKMTAVAAAEDSTKEAEMRYLKTTINMLLERVDQLAQGVTEASPPENMTQRVKMHEELEKKLQEKEDKMHEELEKKLQEKEDKIRQLRKSLDDHSTSQMELEKRLAMIEKILNNTHIQHDPAFSSFTFDMKDFAAMKEQKQQWTSPIFNHDSQNQYKLRLVVWPYGQGEGKGTHVSVWLEQVREKDNPPAHIFVVCELLNQLSDEHHRPAINNFPLTSRYMGVNNELVEHTELEYDALKGTQYLVEDALKFRIRVSIVQIKAT